MRFVFFWIFHYFNDWEEENHAYHYFTITSQCFVVCCYAADPAYYRAGSITGKEDQNDKLNISPKDILSVLLATAATILCIIIDVVSKEESKIRSENQNEGEEQ